MVCGRQDGERRGEVLQVEYGEEGEERGSHFGGSVEFVKGSGCMGVFGAGGWVLAGRLGVYIPYVWFLTKASGG